MTHRGIAISSSSARPDSPPSWSVYTPAHIVAYMLRTSLGPEFESQPLRHRNALRILDPACGDGAFLCGALEFLRNQYDNGSPDIGEIARRHLFGVDIDRSALEVFRRNLRERGIAPPTISELFHTNVLCGDALCGPDLSNRSSLNVSPAESIDWPRAFPEATEAGGFDLVIGNPPYLRERDAKPLFDHLAQSPLGQRWRQARMDLWYYFLHRAIDLARPGGTVCFIVNSYWVGSQGARKLIERLERETTPLEFTRIEAAPIFPGVAGRHLILRLRKGRQLRHCRVIDLSHVGRNASDPSFWHRLAEQGPDSMQDVGVRCHWTDRETLFQHGRISLAPPMETVLAGCVSLESQFEVRQGIAENPPCITAAHMREFGEHYRVGQGVFVLDPSELAALQLSPEEFACVRPYDETASLGRYRLPAEASHAILYLTKHTAPTLERLPRIAAHLEQFRPLLERRREVQKGSIAWWHLHWPREERLFVEPRILSVQMGRRPQFVYAERPTFVGFSVNVVTRRSEATWSLPALTAMLDSNWAAAWFERHAKHRGVHLEINGNVLRQFPLPPFDAEADAELAGHSLARHRCADESAAELETLIDAIVNRIYRVGD